MGTHPIYESDFDCLTDRFGLRDVRTVRACIRVRPGPL